MIDNDLHRACDQHQGEYVISFDVLGEVRLRSTGGAYTPRGPKVRQVLALLLLNGNQTVDVHTLAQELWGTAPPRTALTTIRTHIYHLRTMLEREADLCSAAARLITQPTGYMLTVDRDELDADVFDRLVDRGRTLLYEGRPAEAAYTLRTALAMWRGPALANVVHGPVVAQHVVSLTERRTRALELRIEADLTLGQHRDLVSELRGLVAADPLNEWLQARLVDSLHRCGRRAEALHALRQARVVLGEELGLDPSAELQRLQQEILTGSPHRPGPVAAVAGVVS